MKVIHPLGNYGFVKASPFIISILWLFACQPKVSNHSESELAGLYQLYISENQDADGNWHEDPWTRRGTGYILYDGQGIWPSR